ncbi:cytosolic regulator Pianissimo [Pseudohyphozyma bogoriensis]|nr:cytosolic regulator Pianissimo [Pseudohyphozyma bogoriensis]
MNGHSDQPNGTTVHPNQQQSQLTVLRQKLSIERSIAEGASNLLHVFDQEGPDAAQAPGKADLRSQVERELAGAEENIEKLGRKVRELEEEEEIEAPVPTPSPQDIFSETFAMVVSLLESLQELSIAIDKIKAMDSVVAEVLANPRVKFELKLDEVMPSVLSCLSDSQTTEVRAATYRLVRHLTVDQSDVQLLQHSHLHLFLIRSLSRPPPCDLEKEHCLRLIRALLALPDAYKPVQPSVIRAIVAIAEHAEEKLRLAALETLGELQGLRVVLQSLSDGPHDLSPILAMGFLSVIDKPGTRSFLRPGVDIEIVMAGFAELGKGAGHDDKIKASAKIVGGFLKSWPGLMYLCLNGRQALEGLVSSLKTPHAAIRNTLLEMFADVFNVGRLCVAGTTKRASLLTSLPPQPSASSCTKTIETGTSRANLIDQYLAILLLVFIDAGLIDALVLVASEKHDASASQKVSSLIAEILNLSKRVLPPTPATLVQALPQLFGLTTSFNTSEARLAASEALRKLDGFNRDLERKFGDADVEMRARSNSLEDPLKRGQRQVESAKIRMGMQIDDAHFRNLLLEAGVLSTKDHSRWSFDILTELLEGPLLNPRRLDEAVRASKFMRRLLSFFHPFSYRYGDIRKDGNEAMGRKYTQLGILAINTLLANPDGVRYLAEDKLLPQLADCLAQLDPLAPPVAPSELLLSKYRMEKTLAPGYFEMLGALTKSREGVKLLEQFKIFTYFYRITELKARDDLLKAIICNIDYTMDGHSRVLLSKALTSSYKHVRVFATEFLAKLTREAPDAEEWQIRLLLTQLYDPSQEVCELAIAVLEGACQSLETLQIVVQMRPSLDHLGHMGAAPMLLTRFLSTSIGARYLHEIDFIERELDEWYHERNYTYMIQVELLLASAFGMVDFGHSAKRTPFDGTPPPHFYGELVKTPEGCEILADSGHFPLFADFIQQHGLEDEDVEVISKLKSVLWAVGHVGASPGGLPFLEDEYIVQSIVEIAEDSPVYSLRGTAYFVLGLIASTLEGAELLDELDWDSVCTPIGGPTGICVPRNIDGFVETDSWEPPLQEIPANLLLAPPTNHVERDVLAAFANLSNHILATKASKTLARIKSRHRDIFSSPSLYYRALEMISNYHYRFPVRRYIIELFDIPLDAASATRIMEAGDELRNRGRDIDEDRRMEWDLPTTKPELESMGIDGDFSDASSSPETKEAIPLEVLQPLLTIKGFFIS